MVASLKAEMMPRRPAPGHLLDVPEDEVLRHRPAGLNVASPKTRYKVLKREFIKPEWRFF